MRETYFRTMLDPDLEIGVGVVGGGGSSRPDPEIRGAQSPKNYFRPFRPQFGIKIRGGGTGSPGPSPRNVLRTLFSHPHKKILNLTSGGLVHVVLTNQCRFLRNCPPTPPLSQHFSLSEK